MLLPEMAEDISSVGEDRLIAILTEGLESSPDVIAGPGDDCAVVESGDPDRVELLKTDCVIEGVHFTADADPVSVGWKAAARVVSDFAAMGGGSPQHALVTLITPKDRELEWVRELYAGIRRCGARYGFGIVGGETSRGDICVVSIAMSGAIDRNDLKFRSAAQVGDGIYVTGPLGGSLESGRHLTFEPKLEEASRLVQEFEINAMMDLSDGLAKDLPRLAAASNVGFQLDRDAVPRNSGCSLEQALGDGEDYELLFTSPDPKVDCPRIGLIVPVEESDEFSSGGWDPFTA